MHGFVHRALVLNNGLFFLPWVFDGLCRKAGDFFRVVFLFCFWPSDGFSLSVVYV